jgi:hypothetical protein
MFDPKLAVGDLLTALAVLISAVGVLMELRKDRSLRRKELADNVRRSAGLIVAKLDRWRYLSQYFFDEIQPIITDADILLVKEQSIVGARDFFWRALLAIQAEVAKKKMEEQIEMAYADLYGYEPGIHDLFAGVIERLHRVDDLVLERLVHETQSNIVSLEETKKPFVSATLGNLLRSTAAYLAHRSETLIEETLKPFRAEMARLVSCSDEDIAAKRFVVKPCTEVLPEISPELPSPLYIASSVAACLINDNLSLRIQFRRLMSRPFPDWAPNMTEAGDRSKGRKSKKDAADS